MSLSLPAAADLAETAAAFAHWRSSTPLGSRIPEELWSRAVALAGTHGASKVAPDWQALYGHPVHYLETFGDPERYPGTCCRAAKMRAPRP